MIRFILAEYVQCGAEADRKKLTTMDLHLPELEDALRARWVEGVEGRPAQQTARTEKETPS